jgi:DNA-binding response OmpR family regulator
VKDDPKLARHGYHDAHLSRTARRRGALSSELGISAHLTKPVSQSELREAIFMLLDRNGRGHRSPTALITREAIHQQHVESSLKILLAEDNPVNQKVA